MSPSRRAAPLLFLLVAALCACSPAARRPADDDPAPSRTAASRVDGAPRQPKPANWPAGAVAPDAPIPLDPAVRHGVLSNGLQYYIRENHKPAKRADLRLIVDAGSVLEDEDQRGLAHFVEHMAFNGTARFEKQELIDYLESIGMRFGPDINAYTSFDETVYLLEVPTDDTAIMETAFRILEDWAHQVSFEGEEIDKERGVVVEEWRLGRGAQGRIRDKQLPVMFHGSRYADRIVIGDKAILETAAHDTLRRFYRDWYRPELMAVVAVGDFVVTGVEELFR
jgi:zinc protease